MELYVNYTYGIDSHQSDEQYGDWYEEWDFEINSVHINRPKENYKTNSEVFNVDYDVSVGDTVHVLYMNYSSGDSFGSSSGNAEIIWVFKNKQLALAAEKIWDNAEKEDMIETVTDSGKSMKLSNPAAGYFENVSSIRLESYIVEK